MQPCDREGIFRAEITEFGLKEMDSGSMSVAIRARLTEWFDPANQVWLPWSEYEHEAEGDVWIVKKDGSVNQPAVESLIRWAGWDGNIESVTNETWKPTPCQVTINRETYKEKTRFKISFINNFDRQPGGMSNVSADKAKSIQSRYGPQFRAIAGNASRNGSTPAGSPPAPARPATPPAPPPAPEPQEEKIPF